MTPHPPSGPPITRSHLSLAILSLAVASVAAYYALFVGFQSQASVIEATAPQAVKGGLAVTPKDYDDMGEVLRRLGFSAREITVDTLRDVNNIRGYQAVYLNCSEEWGTYFVDPAFDPTLRAAQEERILQAAAAIREYVRGGGIVYASDFTATLIDVAFPGKIDFYGATVNAAFAGYPGRQMATIVDAGLASVIGKKTIEINYDAPFWIVVENVAPEVRVYMRGPAPIAKSKEPRQFVPDPAAIGGEREVLDLAKTLENKPYVVAFTEGKGAVLYTTFHNEKQKTADTEKILDWFAVWAKGGKARQAVSTATAGGTLIKEIVDSINAGETKKYPFDAPGDGSVQIALGADSGRLGLAVKDGTGKAIINKESDKFPLKEVVAGAKGAYTVEVKGVQVPEKNMPFVLTIAKGGAGAAAPKKPDEVNAKFTFPKQSYKIGELIKGSVIVSKSGKILPYKVAYPSFAKKNTTATKNVRLGKQSIPISIKAEKGGELTVTVTITKPGDNKFQKVFTHQLRVEQVPVPQSSSSRKIVGSCPLTVELVQQMCKLSAPLQPTKSVKDCSIGIGQAAAPFIAAYNSRPYDGDLNKLIQQETNNGETGFQEIRGIGERAFIAGVVPINAVSLLFGEGTKYDTTLYNEAGFSLVVVKGATAHYFSANGLETLTLPAGCSVDEMKELAKTIIK